MAKIRIKSEKLMALQSSCAPLAVLEGFGEVVNFDDVGGVEVGDGAS